ncbi:fibrocystin-L-like [Pollicipes pollicipes]|uniref:fibrocystin-L-like n=1 Tax=Pollicipes pollicipes TaxID=41117 RepID=UPI00188536ED|nr:fibrocystin-L-like [Pollicipes pollicipes]
MGGSTVRITGQGLAADCQRLDITAGDAFVCEPVTCTDTEIMCLVNRRRRRHVIRNNATHPRYGPGYLWQPQHLTVWPGDLVTWRWAPGQVSSDQVGFSVHQTVDQHSDAYDGAGFNSGDKTPQGSFTTMLEDIGTVFYSGESVGTNTVRMRGVIHVVAPPAGSGVLSVRVGSVEAESTPTDGDMPAFVPSEVCSEDPAPAACPASPAPLVLTAADCVTARVTGVSVASGDDSAGHMVEAGSELTISGAGFSETACHNRVTLGSGACQVTSASARARQ